MTRTMALLVWVLMVAPAMAAERPNILFIFLDDYGWRDATYMGSDFYETPHLDRLAKEGMVFTNGYSCAANCAPARACLLSGQYTPRHEIYNVGTGPRGNAKHRKLQHVPGVSTLPTKIRTWAHQLKERGYVTATMGKWHLSSDPLPYGFDINIGGTHSGSPPRGYYPPHNVPGLKDAPTGEYLTDRLSDEAVRFIRQHKNESWALYLTHFAVHTPLNAKKELVAKYEAKTPGRLHQHVAMATMIQAVDDGVGKIRQALKELELEDDTIVIFTSDNGGYGPATDMAPLRGYKGTYYEGGIRVPWFINWPNVIKSGTTCETPVIGVDIYPTILEMTGANTPDQPLDGKSLVPLLKGESHLLDDRAIFWHFPAYLQSYGGGVNAEQRDPLFRSRPCSIVRRGPWKLHQYFEDGGLELYHLENDIGEANNLAKTHPDQLQELLGELQAWQQAVGAPIPTDKNEAYDANVEAAAIAQAKSGGKKKQAKRKRKDKRGS